MKKDINNPYDKTPSFYNSSETFDKYLGRTSYYRVLQDSVNKICRIAEPDEILELGTGTGDTARRISKTLPNSQITAVDNREKIINEARSETQQNNNVNFYVDDMIEYVSRKEKLQKFVLMLYSFHHIPDPVDNKLDFLEKCYESIPDRGYLCIAEGFLPDMDVRDTKLKDLWEMRRKEAYSSTFWDSLEGLNRESINKSQKIGNFSSRYEGRAGQKVVERDEEYLVSRDWIESKAKDQGFNVLISEPCNSLGEGIVLLQK